MAGVINPVTYVRSAGASVGPSWGGSTSEAGCDITIAIPEVSSDDVNPALVYTMQGVDWRSGSTDPLVFYNDSDKTAVDTDWTLVYTNLPAVHEPVAVYYKTNPDIAGAHNVQLVHDGSGGVWGYHHVKVFDNARQVPSCDVVVPATDVQAIHNASTIHTFNVTNYSSDVAWGIISHGIDDRDNQFGYDYDTDITVLWDFTYIREASTNLEAGQIKGGWMTGDTTTYTAQADPVGNWNSVIYQVYPYEVELTAVDGTIEFSSAFDWGRASVMVLDTFEGLVEFVGEYNIRFFRTFESVIQFSSTIGKKTSKFFGGLLDLIGHRVDWRFLYQKIKYTIRMWMGSVEQDIESEISLSAGSSDQPTKASIRMPWDDPTRR